MSVKRALTVLYLCPSGSLCGGGGGEGGIPLYKSYGYVPPQRVSILGLFGLKTGTDFDHFGLELGVVFEGATGMYERIYRFNPKSVRRTQ